MDVHFVMSVALPFVNYISHIEKKLVSGESSKSHSSTMQKVVMVSSAMLLFEVIKNVMTSTVPEEKKSIPKPSDFMLRVLTVETGNRSHRNPR